MFKKFFINKYLFNNLLIIKLINILKVFYQIKKFNYYFYIKISYIMRKKKL